MATRERRGAPATGDVGFTLVELLVIMLILSILAATVVFLLSGVSGTSVKSACASDARTVDLAAASYLSENPFTTQVTEAQLTARGTGTLASWPPSKTNAYAIVLAGDNSSLVGHLDADGHTIGANDVLVKIGSTYYDATAALPAACSDA